MSKETSIKLFEQHKSANHGMMKKKSGTFRLQI